MAAMSSRAAVVAAALLAVVAAAAGAGGGGVSCGDAVNALIPCGGFLIGAGPAQPSRQCCDSAKALAKMAATTAMKRLLCECFERTGPSFGVLPDRARKLPPACKLQLGIPLTPTYNCTLIR